jgi:uncharacterized protein (DUF58 family)
MSQIEVKSMPSPVRVTQRDLIMLSNTAKVIPLDALRIKSLQAGSYVSQFKGRGMEFDESRPYQPGDDPRNIDWRVTARSTEAYTKLYREERERPVYVVTDLRSNMHFATRGRFKSVAASYVAGCISWAAHHRGDRLGGIVFGDNICKEVRPRIGRQAALRYLHHVAEHPDWNATLSIDESIQHASFLKATTALRRVVRPGSLVVIISDFMGFSGMCHSSLAKLVRHNELLAIFISDPIEMIPPPPGRYRIVSAGQDRLIETYSKQARNQYANAFIERKTDLVNFFRRYGIHHMSISTDEDPIEAVKNSLGRQRKRQGKR